jgi:hypothetical protein
VTPRLAVAPDPGIPHAGVFFSVQLVFRAARGVRQLRHADFLRCADHNGIKLNIASAVCCGHGAMENFSSLSNMRARAITPPVATSLPTSS